MVNNNQLSLIPPSKIEKIHGYGSLNFRGEEFEEFKELSSYIYEAQKSIREKSMPDAGLDLLATMQSDIVKFMQMISWSQYDTQDESNHKYYDIPIFKYIEPVAFIKILSSMNTEDKTSVFITLTERYAHQFNEKLIEELRWLRSIRDLLQTEASIKKGKVSGFNLTMLIKTHLDEIIKKLTPNES